MVNADKAERLLSMIDMVHDVVLSHFDHAFDNNIFDESPIEIDLVLESVTNPTINDVHAVCAEIERIKFIPYAIAMRLEKWCLQVKVVIKALNGTAETAPGAAMQGAPSVEKESAMPQEATALAATVQQILVFVEESQVIESIREHGKSAQVTETSNSIITRLLENKGEGRLQIKFFINIHFSYRQQLNSHQVHD